MSDHYIDSEFRRRLADQSAAVPAGMWEAIQVQVPKANRRRRVLWLPILLTGLGLAVIAALLLRPDNQTNTAESPNNNNPTELALAPLTNDHPAETGEYAQANGSATTSVTAEKKESSTTISANDSKKNAMQESQTVESDADRFSMNDQALKTSQVSQLTAARKEPLTSSEKIQLVNLPTEPKANESMSPELPYLSIQSLEQTGVLAVSRTDEAMPPTDCYNFGGGGVGNFMLDVYAGPSLHFRSLTSRNEDVSDYINARDSTESLRMGMNAGVRLSYYLPTGLFARAGLHYQQVNELFDLIDATSIRDIITIDSIFDTNGQFIRVDRDTVTTTGTRIKKTYNRFHTVDIPLLVGYQIEHGDWSYGIQAGPVINIAFSKKGDILTPNGVPGSFGDSNDPDYNPVFKDNLGLGVYGAGFIQRRIGENLFAFAEPHVLHRIKSITLDGYPIEHRQTVGGLALGVRIKL